MKKTPISNSNEGIKQPNQVQVKKAVQDPTVNKIQQMERERQERRELMEQRKIEKAEREELNKKMGKNVDIDFELMIERQKFKEAQFQAHTSAQNVRLCVCVRKRPIFKKEEANGEIDSISCANPSIRVLAPKFKVDGITKQVENFDFTYDNTFSERETSQDVYNYSLSPLIDLIINGGGVVTCFAYGQTGSGKTYTMQGIQEYFVNDAYNLLQSQKKDYQFFVTFFEIYGGRCYDLLNNKNQLVILEDKNNNVQINGIVEKQAETSQDMLQLIEFGHSVRTTHQTQSNDTSSRSHAICSLILKNSQGQQVGKLVLVDLAGSERAADCQSNNRQRRMEGAEINKSLLALKECIRSMDIGAQHVPFRASKLTLVLRDSFQSRAKNTKIVMIACISPGSSSSDHSINTLRYADRLKENKPVISKAQDYAEDQIQQPIQKEMQPQKQDQVEPRQKPPIPIEKIDDAQKGGAQFHKKDSPSNQNNPIRKDSPSNLPTGQNNVQKKPSFHKQSSPRSAKEQQNPSQQLKPPQPQNKNISSSEKENNSDEDILPQPKQIKGAREDVRSMKETMRPENQKLISNEYFDFQEKVVNIYEEQEEIFATHMAAIKEDAKLLTQESDLISKVQDVGFMDYDIDLYVKKLESVIKKKLKMYNLLSKKLDGFKKVLQEEEEISSKVKDTVVFY